MYKLGYMYVVSKKCWQSVIIKKFKKKQKIREDQKLLFITIFINFKEEILKYTNYVSTSITTKN